ncbi:MAG: DUF5667 domain-containing protein, partial [bacterium]
MTKLHPEQLEKDLSILGKNAVLSLTQRQKLRDRLFKQIGQLDLVEAMQTHTEAGDLVMPLNKLRYIFRPQRIVFGLPATAGVVVAVFLATLTTGAMAQSARPGDPLFGVRRTFETVQIALTTNPAKKAEMKLAILGDRLQDLQTVDGKNLEVVLQESQKAIASAQSAITDLKGADTETSAGLVAKLKALIDNQRTTLATTIKGGVGNAELTKSFLAMRDELDILLPTDNPQPTNDKTNSVAAAMPVPVIDDTSRTNFYGSLTTNYGAPALFENGKA